MKKAYYKHLGGFCQIDLPENRDGLPAGVGRKFRVIDCYFTQRLVGEVGVCIAQPLEGLRVRLRFDHIQSRGYALEGNGKPAPDVTTIPLVEDFLVTQVQEVDEDGDK